LVPPKEILSKAIEFHVLVKFLEEKNLIGLFELEFPENIVNGSIVIYYSEAEQFKTAPMIREFLNKYTAKRIIPLAHLDSYIDNNYTTAEQMKYDTERKRSQMSLRLAFGAAIVSLVVGAGTTVFNYLNYTNNSKDKSITIANPTSLPDTIKVYNVSPTIPINSSP
jgi:hypothetical protein